MFRFLLILLPIVVVLTACDNTQRPPKESDKTDVFLKSVAEVEYRNGASSLILKKNGAFEYNYNAVVYYYSEGDVKARFPSESLCRLKISGTFKFIQLKKPTYDQQPLQQLRLVLNTSESIRPEGNDLRRFSESQLALCEDFAQTSLRVKAFNWDVHKYDSDSLFLDHTSNLSILGKNNSWLYVAYQNQPTIQLLRRDNLLPIYFVRQNARISLMDQFVKDLSGGPMMMAHSNNLVTDVFVSKDYTLTFINPKCNFTYLLGIKDIFHDSEELKAELSSSEGIKESSPVRPEIEEDCAKIKKSLVQLSDRSIPIYYSSTHQKSGVKDRRLGFILERDQHFNRNGRVLEFTSPRGE